MSLAERAVAAALLNERPSIARAMSIPMPKTKILPAKAENILASSLPSCVLGQFAKALRVRTGLNSKTVVRKQQATKIVVRKCNSEVAKRERPRVPSRKNSDSGVVLVSS